MAVSQLKIELSYYPASPLLGVYPKKTKEFEKITCAAMFISSVQLLSPV